MLHSWKCHISLHLLALTSDTLITLVTPDVCFVLSKHNFQIELLTMQL